MEPNLPQLLDDEQLADYLGVKARFVRRLCDENRLRYVLVGRRRRYDPADVADCLAREKRGGPQEAEDPQPRRSGRPLRSATARGR